MRRQWRDRDARPEYHDGTHVSLPSWAPRKLRDQLRRESDSLRREALQRLLTHPHMEDVWDHIRKLANRCNVDPGEARRKFAFYVLGALRLPAGLGSMSPKEAQDLASKIKKKNADLSKLLGKAGLGLPLQLAGRVCFFVSPGRTVPAPNLSVDRVLELLASFATNHAAKPRELAKPGTPGKPGYLHARTRYMVLELTRIRDGWLGEGWRGSPSQQAVAVTTTVALKLDRWLTRDDVRQMARPRRGSTG